MDASPAPDAQVGCPHQSVWRRCHGDTSAGDRTERQHPLPFLRPEQYRGGRPSLPMVARERTGLTPPAQPLSHICTTLANTPSIPSQERNSNTTNYSLPTRNEHPKLPSQEASGMCHACAKPPKIKSNHPIPNSPTVKTTEKNTPATTNPNQKSLYLFPLYNI